MRLRTKPPLLALVLPFLAGLLALVPGSPTEDPFYPVFLGIRKPLAAPREPILVEAAEGQSLTPSALGRLLWSLAEFGSGPVIIDLPLDWTTPDGAAVPAPARSRDTVSSELDLVSANLEAFWAGLRSGALRPADASTSFAALSAGLVTARSRLLDLFSPPAGSLASLVASLDIGPPAWLALRLATVPVVPDPTGAAFLDRVAQTLIVEKVRSRRFTIPAIVGLQAQPTDLEGAAAGFGWSAWSDDTPSRGSFFPVADFRPLATYEGRILPELALSALAGRLGATSIRVGSRGVELDGVRLPRRAAGKLLIPLDPQGQALFDRRAASGGETRRLSIARLEEYRQAEAELLRAVLELERAGFLVERAPPSREWQRAAALEARLLARTVTPRGGIEAELGPASPAGVTSISKGRGSTGAISQATVPGVGLAPGSPEAASPVPSSSDATSPVPTSTGLGAAPIEAPTQGPGFEPTVNLDTWLAAKLAFFAASRSALDERRRIDELCAGLLSTPGLSEAGRLGVVDLRDKADRAFEAAATALASLTARRAALAEALGGSFVIVGEEARRSLGGFLPEGGVGPFDPSARMADFIRAGLSGRFIEAAHPGYSAGLAALAALALSLALFFTRPRLVLAAGVVLATTFAAITAIALAALGLWISPLAPIAASLLPGLLASLRFVVGDATEDLGAEAAPSASTSAAPGRTGPAPASTGPAPVRLSAKLPPPDA